MAPAARPMAAADLEPERFRPAQRADTGEIRELPLELEDVNCLHACLRAIVDFSWVTYRALRTIPPTPGVSEPVRSVWTALDTAVTVRMRGSRAFAVLAQPVPRTQRRNALTAHFEPLLTPGGERWADAVLLASSRQGEPPWRIPPPPAGSYVRGLGALTGTFFEQFIATIEPSEDVRSAAWQRALYFAFAVAAIVTVPVRSIYRAFHGTAAIELVEPRVAAACTHLRELLAGGWVGLLGSISPEAPDAYRQLFGEVISTREGVGCALTRESLTAPRRSRFNAADFGGRDFLELKDADQRREVVRVLQTADTLLRQPVDDEIYWALPHAWERLRRASDLVNEAGFALVLNAANNRWGGAHPPHQTHQNGLCFDLDVAVPFTPGDVESLARGEGFRLLPNLGRRRRVDAPRGELTDERGRRFDLVPERGEGPSTHTKVDRLALWITLQAMQVAGMNNVLYADFENMDQSLLHLVGRLLGQSLQTVATRFGNLPRPGDPRQLFEPVGHFDHLHVEAAAIGADQPVLPGSFTGFDAWGGLHARLLELARDRDKSQTFIEFAFGPEEPRTTLEGRYRTHWRERTAQGRTPLLPVWDQSLCPRLDRNGRCLRR